VGALEQLLIREQLAIADLLTPAPQPVGLRAAVARIAPRPVLLIAGAGEAAVLRAYADGAPGDVEVWDVPDAPHIGALATHAQEWRTRVLAFLDRSLAN